jgi:decaprenylphospho-beta-D-ribofuranose 2-oxidase
MFQRISGWGRSVFSFSRIESVKFLDFSSVRDNTRGAIPRGLGRSYGDSANNSGGICVDTKELKEITIDPVNGIAVVGSGVTIEELENAALELGFFPYVVPGTAKVTIGGAIASDIHGKSHHLDGSFSKHLIELRLLTGSGTEIALRPEGDSSRIFWATVGGMGLTGVILEATVSLRRISSEYLEVSEKRVKGLKELLQTILEFNQRYLYTVAWIDLSGKFLGRGIVSGANHVLSNKNSHGSNLGTLAPLTRREIRIPFLSNLRLVNSVTIRIFNALWFYKPLGRKIQHLQKYMHPLDAISNWNEVYGKKGFIQYQFLIPFESETLLKQVLIKLADYNCNSFLAVLKSFGDSSNGLLSFPQNGWTLAIDLPLSDPKINQLLRELDQLVLSAKGRLYLTKDSRMNHTHLPLMYPDLLVWKEVKRFVDPNNVWQSDQGRRLHLC